MPTRYCFNPKDPKLRRYVLTEALIDEGFVECPEPGQKLPPSMLGGSGGVIDQTTTELAKVLRDRMGKVPSEAEIIAVTEHLLRLDPKELAAAMPGIAAQAAASISDLDIAGIIPVTNKSAMDMVDTDIEDDQLNISTPPVVEEPQNSEDNQPASSILYMSDVPTVPVNETQEDAVKRVFGKRMADIPKEEICKKALNALKVELDLSKQKKDLVRDYQLAEIARKGK